MFCRNCGKEIHDEAVICPNCGVETGVGKDSQATDVKDNGGIGWGLLGCCIPVVGLILFLVWHDNKPKTAKAAGKGALISVILTVLFYIILFAFGMGESLTYM